MVAPDLEGVLKGEGMGGGECVLTVNGIGGCFVVFLPSRHRCSSHCRGGSNNNKDIFLFSGQWQFVTLGHRGVLPLINECYEVP